MRRWWDAEAEGDGGTCEEPGSASGWGYWWDENDRGGGVGRGAVVVAEEGSTEDVPRELGARSGREE